MPKLKNSYATFWVIFKQCAGGNMTFDPKLGLVSLIISHET